MLETRSCGGWNERGIIISFESEKEGAEGGDISYLLSVQHRHNTLSSDHRSFMSSFSADDVVVFVLI